MRRPSSSIVKRWTLKLTLCLLEGAVVTWAVAWGCALWGDRPTRLTHLGPENQPDRTSGRWPSDETPAGWRQTRSALYFEARLPGRRTRAARDENYHHSITVSDFGFPFLGLRHVRRADDGGPEELVVGLLPPEFAHARIEGSYGLPTRILPLGFALDTLLYGGVMLGMVEGVGFARRRWRRAKGTCPSCAYDRRGLAAGAGCPECGERPSEGELERF